MPPTVIKMTRRGVPLSFFRLGDEPRLARFLDDIARRNGGRVLAPEGDRLGDYVVSDYLERRSGGRRRSAWPSLSRSMWLPLPSAEMSAHVLSTAGPWPAGKRRGRRTDIREPPSA